MQIFHKMTKAYQSGLSRKASVAGSFVLPKSPQYRFPKDKMVQSTRAATLKRY